MADIEYRTDLVPGQRHFDCATLHATLDTGSCADRWERATMPDMERFISCRRCPTGRQHHAEHNQSQQDAPQPIRASVCIRCGAPSRRLIGNEICVSCFNRYREFVKGRNARGTAPSTYIPPGQRRVGIVSHNGVPAWQLFQGQYFDESMARATRAGLRLSNEQPGRNVWNEHSQAFEYRDENGRVLIEYEEEDGRLEYIDVDQLHPGEHPAPVRMPTQLLTAGEAANWLIVSGEAASLGVDVHQLEFGCARCRQAMLHGRKTQTGIQVWCNAGCGHFCDG